ncbi:FUN14 domain-containing protein, partial [Palaeococcus sp. (in: euryarchaeotes)]
MEFDMGSMLGDIGVGGIVGFITGYALKKFIKIVLALIGAYVI